MCQWREMAEAGCLVSYGPSFMEAYRLTAAQMDRVLRGASPAELPVQQPTRFELIINLTAARALRLDLAPTLLARADEVIE
jgi:putative ABC transport system substrate-binding protein